MQNASTPEPVKSAAIAESQPRPLEAAPKGRQRWWIAGAIVLALAMLFFFRGTIALILPQPLAGWLAPAKTGVGAPPPRLVGVATATVRIVPVQVSAIGSIDPLRTVNVKSRVDGQVVAVKFKAGDAVKAGEVLFLLDDRPAQAALQQAQGALARDIATLENQKRDYARQEQLMAAKITTQQEYDAARTAVAVTTQILAVDRAAVENAKLALDYNTIRAPISGRTGKVLIDLGNVVKANDTVSMVAINQIQPIYVTFAVPQRYLDEIRGRYRAGNLPVAVTPPESGQALATGRLDFIDNSVDASTGTIQLRAIFSNETEVLWPGQFVNATLVLRNDPTAVTVPPEAVQTGREGSFVYVVTGDNTVQYRPVTVDRVVGGVAVIAKGLAPDEIVVTDGQLNLVDGSRVQAAIPGGRSGAGGAPAGAAQPGAQAVAPAPGAKSGAPEGGSAGNK